MLFLLDGERLAGEGSSNNIDYTRIDVDNIKRIEIVKGPMSTLYGSQAMGGVVNIITKDAVLLREIFLPNIAIKEIRNIQFPEVHA